MTPLEHLERMWDANNAAEAACLETYYGRERRRRNLIHATRRFVFAVAGGLGAFVGAALVLSALVVFGVLP